MVKLIFKDVGQGDSIILEWNEGPVVHYGIIDCNLKGISNPVFDEIRTKSIKHIDFIILTHLHVDHFSGMPSLLQYCSDNKIEIGFLYHTLEIQYLKIFEYIFTTQRDQKLAQQLLGLIHTLSNSGIIKNVASVSNTTRPHVLGTGNEIQFLSPTGTDYLNFSENQAKYLKGKISTLPDMNALSVISKITNHVDAALLTADTTIKPLKRLTGKINEALICIQVPHHGSDHNHEPSFWSSINKKQDCPAVFSVGDVKRDKIPKQSVVEFFDTQGYYIESTNFVYGIVEHFGGNTLVNTHAKQISNRLSAFSTLKKTTLANSGIPPDRFTGDKIHNIL